MAKSELPENPGVRIACKLRALEEKHRGEFFVRAERLENLPGGFSLREATVLPTASTMKLFVLCELFRQAEAGETDLREPVTWTPEFHRGGDGVLRAMTPGQQLSMHNMAVLMTIVSDNIATAVLVHRLGAERITSTMRSWGLADTNIFQGLPGGTGAETMRQPVSSPRDLCRLLVMVARREILTPASCAEIIRILRAQRCNDMLPRHIPVGEDWGDSTDWIANKTGYGECRVEAGLVRMGPLFFALAMFFKSRQEVALRFKSLADYPPVLAMAEGCKAVFDGFSDDTLWLRPHRAAR